MKNEHTSRLPGLMALWVFGIFALCILLVLLSGSESYRRLTARGQTAFQNRTATGYIATRIRQADREDAISLETFGDSDALVIRETVGEKTYLTRIYCYNGALWELYTPESGHFSPEDGERLVEIDSLRLSLEKGLLTAQVGSQKLQLLLRSKGGIL